MSNEMDEMELLRKFRAGLPSSPREDTRRLIYERATRAGRLMWLVRLLHAPGFRSVARPPRTRALRWGVACLILVLAASGAALVMTTRASGGQGIDATVAQLHSSFGDEQLISASVDGSTLRVMVNAPDEPSGVRATFEAQMLADAVSDSMSGGGRPLIDSVHYLSANGGPVPQYGTDPVAPDPSIPALADGACKSAAQEAQDAIAAQAPLQVISVVTLPYGGGTCAFKFQTSDPASFAAEAPWAVGHLDNAMGAPNERPLFVEVDDQAGVPQFVYSYTPSAGGTAYIKPGLSRSFIP